MPHLLRHGISIFKVISERPVILTFESRALCEETITTYFKRLGFDAAGVVKRNDPGPSGTRTHDLPDAKRKHYHEATATGQYVGIKQKLPE
jgi:hypothetical protein